MDQRGWIISPRPHPTVPALRNKPICRGISLFVVGWIQSRWIDNKRGLTASPRPHPTVPALRSRCGIASVWRAITTLHIYYIMVQLHYKLYYIILQIIMTMIMIMIIVIMILMPSHRARLEVAVQDHLRVKAIVTLPPCKGFSHVTSV